MMKKYRSERKGRRSFDTALHYSSLEHHGEKRGPQSRRSALLAEVFSSTVFLARSTVRSGP